MRLMMLRLVIGCMVLALTAEAGATSWTSAKVPGEQNRAVQGCADDAPNPGDWFCIFIRCDRPGSPLTLYFSAPGPDIRGDIKLVIDEDTFAVSVPTSPKSALPSSTRAQAMSEALIDAMKAGSTISVQGSHASAVQSHFVGELTQSHREDRVGMFAPISQRRAVVAAHDAEIRFLVR